MGISAVVLATTFALRSFDHLSSATKMKASFLNSTERCPKKSNCTFLFVSTARASWTTLIYLVPYLNFRLVQCNDGN